MSSKSELNGLLAHSYKEEVDGFRVILPGFGFHTLEPSAAKIESQILVSVVLSKSSGKKFSSLQIF